jgi:hypothetical protein
VASEFKSMCIGCCRCTGGQVVFNPSDALCRPHHPLECPAVVGSAVAVPGGDTAQQDALNCASVNICEGFRCQAKFLLPLEVEEALLRLFPHTVCVEAANTFIFYCGTVSVSFKSMISWTLTMEFVHCATRRELACLVIF